MNETSTPNDPDPQDAPGPQDPMTDAGASDEPHGSEASSSEPTSDLGGATAADGGSYASAGSPYAPPPRRLFRSERDRMIGGVAGGLAHYLGLDPVLVRIGFVLLAIFGGTGLILYFIGWIVMPTESAPPGARRSFPPFVSVILAVIGFLIVANITGNILFTDNHGDGSPVFWALVLVGIGVLLFRQDTRMAHAGAAAPAVPVAGPAAATGSTAAYEPWTQPATPPRPRSILGRLTLAFTLLAVGVAAILHNLGVVAMGPSEYFALAVVGIGAGLLVGAWRGRAYWLILIGALLLPPTFASSFVASQGISFRGGVGERFYEFESISEIEPSYHLGAGFMQLDFSDVELDEVHLVEVSMGAGEMFVIVPEDTRVDVSGTIRAGDVVLFGDRRGYDPGQINTFSAVNGAEESPGLLRLDLEMGLGEITVIEEGAVTFGEIPPLRGGPFFRDRDRLFDRDEHMFEFEDQEL